MNELTTVVLWVLWVLTVGWLLPLAGVVLLLVLLLCRWESLITRWWGLRANTKNCWRRTKLRWIPLLITIKVSKTLLRTTINHLKPKLSIFNHVWRQRSPKFFRILPPVNHPTPRTNLDWKKFIPLSPAKVFREIMPPPRQSLMTYNVTILKENIV